MLHINAIVWCQLVLTVPSQIMQPILPNTAAGIVEKANWWLIAYEYHNSSNPQAKQTSLLHKQSAAVLRYLDREDYIIFGRLVSTEPSPKTLFI